MTSSLIVEVKNLTLHPLFGSPANLNSLYAAGIISQDQYAFEMGYEKPNEKEPRVPLNKLEDGDDGAKKQKREADKDKSDRSQRDKSKTVPKRKDGDTKER